MPVPKSRPGRPVPPRPTTLLRYAMVKHLGQPTCVLGEDLWPCGRCGSLKRHCRPHKPPHKDSYGCWACGDFGDLYDLLKEAGVSWPSRPGRAAELAAEYQAEGYGRVDADPRFSVPATAAEVNARQAARLVGALWGLTLRAEGRSPGYTADAFGSLAATAADR